MIKIGKTKYKVFRVDRFKNPLVRGQADLTAYTIHIADRAGVPLRKRTVAHKRHTMWHELVHAILHDMGSRKTHDEVFVDALAKRIGQVVQQGPNIQYD